MTIEVINSDCLLALKGYPDNYFDSIVTDPPYGIAFMGKRWDYDIPSVEVWKEVLRVLKPGGHMLCACGTRTQHRMAVNIEDAGFEIRDIISWLYGCGMPKGLDVSKAIDKIQGNKREKVPIGEPVKRMIPGADQNKTGSWIKNNGREYQPGIEIPVSLEAKQWQGWNTNLKPAQELFTLARKPISEKTIAANVLKWGTGGLNIDDCRVPINPHVDDKRLGGNGSWSSEKMAKNVYEGGYKGIRVTSSKKGRYPANVIHDGSDEVVSHFPDNCGAQAPVKGTEPSHIGQNGIYNPYGRVPSEVIDRKDSAARFFKEVKNTMCCICQDIQRNQKDLDLWKRLFANNAARNFTITNQIIEYTALQNALPIVDEQFVQNVKFAGSLCDSCATRIALALVGIKIWDFNQEELHLILDFIGNYKRCILIQNLVSFAEIWDNIDIIPTTKSLSILFGSVQHAIENYTKKVIREKEEQKLELSRLIYAPKASKKERGEGNTHSTVKPIKLMKYLVTLITPPNGKVLDCYAGSGSTGLACQELGFDCTLIEKEKEYCDIINQRLKNADVTKKDDQQLNLFDGVSI